MTYHTLIEKCVCDVNKRDCMLQLCQKCPRSAGVNSFLMSLNSVTDHEYSVIIFKQWVSTDRCHLIEVAEDYETFTESLSNKINQLTRHHFVAKNQSIYFKNIKENVKTNEVVVVGDFSENYSFTVQDEVQSFHFNRPQCTVHPFCVYYKESNNLETKHQTFCFFSSNTNHDAVMFYTFLKKLIPFLKNSHPNITKIHYFSEKLKVTKNVNLAII